MKRKSINPTEGSLLLTSMPGNNPNQIWWPDLSVWGMVGRVTLLSTVGLTLAHYRVAFRFATKQRQILGCLKKVIGYAISVV